MSQSVTIRLLQKMKAKQQTVAMLTAYDASFAKVLEQAGVDVILVGDSLGMVVQGHETTVPVTMDDMVYHAKAVSGAVSRPLILVDMPFMAYADPAMAVRNAARLMQQGGAQMVKLEGGRSQVTTVKALSEQGIPVCAHLGLTPQSVHKLSGYRVQGKQAADAQALLDDAQALQEAGADLILVECIPPALTTRLLETVTVPVIGIGAGDACDGQVLVLHDVLGISEFKPRFARCFMDAQHWTIQQAIAAYVQAVKDKTFPNLEERF